MRARCFGLLIVALLCCGVFAPAVHAQTVRRGACCLPNKSCVVVSKLNCTKRLGSFQGVNVACTAQMCRPQPIRGACCLADNSCVVISRLNCSKQQGTFKGADSTCVANLCQPQPIRGACCVEGGCVFIMRIGCNARGGVFKGQDFACDPFPCPGSNPLGTGPMGACCTSAGLCQITSEITCAGVAGFYAGNSTTCDTAPCIPGMGACCRNGACLQMTQPTCGGTGGVFLGVSTACASVSCAAPTGACCAGVNACQVLTVQACGDAGGVFIGLNTSCGSIACIPGLGACCTGSVCVLVSAVECANYPGLYKGEGTLCVAGVCPLAPIDAPYACCMPSTGACVLLGRNDCLLQHGGFRYQATCSQVDCSIVYGACCAPGQCRAITQADCIDLGGSWDSTRSCTASFCARTCECDWDRSRYVDINDLYAFLNDYNLGLGDFDNNGVVNNDDARGFVGCLLMHRDQPCP